MSIGCIRVLKGLGLIGVRFLVNRVGFEGSRCRVYRVYRRRGFGRFGAGARGRSGSGCRDLGFWDGLGFREFRPWGPVFCRRLAYPPTKWGDKYDGLREVAR